MATRPCVTTAASRHLPFRAICHLGSDTRTPGVNKIELSLKLLRKENGLNNQCSLKETLLINCKALSWSRQKQLVQLSKHL